MLDVLPDAQQFPAQPELLLDGVEGRDRRWQRVRTEQVPGVEAREVLQCAQEFVAPDCFGGGVSRRGGWEGEWERGIEGEGLG